MGNRNPTFVANAFIITVIRRQAMWPIERIRREHADGGKSFFFDAKFARERSSGEKTDGRAGSPPLLYGGERLKGQQPSEHVIVVEGEKKVDELRKRFGAVAVSGDSGADSKWLAEHAKLLRGFRVVLWPDSDDAGEKYIAKAAAAIRADDPTANIRVVRPFPPAAKGEKGKDVCDWPGEADAFSHLMAGAEQYRVAAHGDEGPRPLMRETPAGEAFPVDALGEVLGGAVKGIVDIAQCPEALTAGSVLSAAALAAQALADVVFPATGQAKPLSLYMLTVGSSGERKSASDDFALAPVRQREAELQTQRDIDLTVWKATHRAWELSKKRAEQGKDLHAIRQELLKLGDEPPPPLEAILTIADPTWEGIQRAFPDAQPSMGLFNSDAADFINGHAFSDDAKARSIAGLSRVWDNGEIRRTRASERSVLYGKRLSVHLMTQGAVAASMLSDTLLLEQGYLSRFLVAAPASKIGTRFHRDAQPESHAALERYNAHILTLLRAPRQMRPNERNSLAPKRLLFNPGARERLIRFSDQVEAQLGQGGELHSTKGFGAKLAEHAARIAGVLTVVDNENADAVNEETLERAVRIAVFYAGEALRLFQAGEADTQFAKADRLRRWLQDEWDEPLISTVSIYNFGPNEIRTAAAAKPLIEILEQHGWLIREPGGGVVRGKRAKLVWRIVRES